MKCEDNEEIMELINDIIEINNQQLNPNKDEIVKLINKLQPKFAMKSFLYETQGLTDFNLSPLNEMDIKLLVSKLPSYKFMCVNKIREKCGDNTYNEIVKYYNIY